MNRILLEFDKTNDKISGNPYGEQVFNSQVLDKIDWEDINTIVFPSYIKDVGNSFIQGFSKPIILVIGRSKYKELIIYEASTESLTRKLNMGGLL